MFLSTSNNCGEFINLYSEDNPILETGDICYCCLFTNDNWHRPLIVRANIVKDKFVDGLNKQYYIRILDILESEKTVLTYWVAHPVNVYKVNSDESFQNRTIRQITLNFDYSNYLFKVDGYFVRNSEEKIRELRKEYISVVREDLEKMINDIDSILF